MGIANAQRGDQSIDSSTVMKAFHACVKLYGIDSASGKQNSAQFSGVVVDDEGSILTVAHAVKPGNSYRVIFPSGKLGTAKALGRMVFDQQTIRPDVAMMKMDGEGKWPYAEMGWSSSMAVDQLCFGWSYPESLGFDKPLLRTGKIVKPMDDFGFLESTCLMETGDSGGPLFDAFGRVIGLHSRIDRPEDISYEVPVDSYRMYWDSLTMAKEYKVAPKVKQTIGLDPKLKDLNHLIYDQNRFSGNPLDVKEKTAVKIFSQIGDDTKEILATVFLQPNGSQILLSKSSEVGSKPSVKYENKVLNLEVIKRSRELDLVLLRSPVDFPVAIPVTELKKFYSIYLGSPVLSVIADAGVKRGVVGMFDVNLPNRFSGGSLGVRLQEIDGMPTVTSVDKENSIFQKGDRISRVDNQDVSSAQKINSTLSSYYPGDTVMVQFFRGELDMQKTIVLQARAFREQNHPMNQFIGGKSVRRDGWKHVFLHDSMVHSYECGGPIYLDDGRFIGMNIARFSHTTNIAIAAEYIHEFLLNNS